MVYRMKMVEKTLGVIALLEVGRLGDEDDNDNVQKQWRSLDS